MNPETNRFEPLYTDEELVKMRHDEARTMNVGMQIEALQKTEGRLYRADGSLTPEHWSVFKVGQEVVLEGYVFRVAYINDVSLLLEPLGSFKDIKRERGAP